MKKLLCMMLVCISIVASASSESDYSSMTDEQLFSIITAARNELASREKHDYLVNDEYIRIYKTGDGITGSYQSDLGIKNYLGMNVVIENVSDSPLGVFMDKVTINGWETDPVSSRSGEIDAGMKKQWYFEMIYTDAGLSDFRDIKEVTFSFYIGEMFDKLKEYKISIIANEG